MSVTVDEKYFEELERIKNYEVARMDAQIQSLQSQLEQYKAWYLESKLRYNNLDGHNLNLQSQLDEANDKLVLNDSYLTELEATNTNLHAELAEANKKIEAQRERIVYFEGATNHAGGTPLSKAEALLVKIRDHERVGLGGKYNCGWNDAVSSCAAIASEYFCGKPVEAEKGGGEE